MWNRLMMPDKLKDAPQPDILKTKEQIEEVERELKNLTRNDFEKFRIANLQALREASTRFLG